MTRFLNSAALAALLVLTACSAGPRPDVPAIARVDPPAAWQTEATKGQIDTQWWRSFNDPDLTQAVETALTYNSDIHIAVARVSEARAQLRQASAQNLPTLNVLTGGAHSRDLNAFGEPVTQDAGRVQLTVAYDTDLFGRLSTMTEAARANLLATEAARDNVRLAVAATTVTAYINLRASDARLAVLDETLAARTQALHLAQRRAAAGYSVNLEVEQAQVEYETAAQLIPATRQAIRHQEDALSLLLGATPSTIARGSHLAALTPPDVPAGLPSDLLRQRPDVLQAEYGLVAADQNLDSARAAFMPSLQLSFGGGYVGSTLIRNPVDVFSLGGSLLAPIFTGGRLHAQADSAAARRDQAAFGYQKAVLNGFREVEDALSAINELAAQETSVVAQRAALARGLALATERYNAGYSPYLEQLDAQRGLLAADLTLVQVHTDRLSAAVSLFQALGGGWVSPSDVR